jgi:hypothetical protein
LSSLYLIPFLYFEFGKMEVKGEQALSVVENHEIAFEIKWPCQEDCAVIHSGYGSAAGDAEIQAKVGALGLAVEDALGVEDVGNFSVGRRGE